MLISQKRVECMQFCFGGTVSGMSKFWRTKSTKPNVFAINNNLSTPFIAMTIPRNTNKPVFVSFCGRKVLSVLRSISLSQIVKLIVAWVAINVVNVFVRPTPMNIKPCQSVSQIACGIDGNGQSSISGSVSSNITNFDVSFSTYTPCKQSSFGIVMQQLTHKFWGKIRFSHDAPYKRIGQRLESVSALIGLRHFNTSEVKNVS